MITNYTTWSTFLYEQGFFDYYSTLEGELYPGGDKKPKTIEPADFNDYFVMAAMMGLRGHLEDEIEIIDIGRINNNIVNVIVRMYKPSFGAGATSAPYHIVVVKKEFLPKGNSTFVFIDTEGKELGKIEVRE